jgi:hypothetical protein
MARGKNVTSPDGDRWRIPRRWSDRPLPNPWRRFRRTANEVDDANLVPEIRFSSMTSETWWIGPALTITAIVIFIVLIPLLGIALELIVLFVVFSSGLAGRVLLGRPWVIEAIDLDEGERSAAYAVKGFRRAGDAVAELTTAIAADGPPGRLSAGERTELPRPSSEPSA